MKIAYVVEALFLRGGIERIISDKANYLAEHFGYDIYIITCAQKPDQPNSFRLSKKIKQIYLNIPYYSQYRYKYPKRLWIKYTINKALKRSLNNTIKELNPDILIGMGQFKGDLISSVPCHAIKLIESHEARCFTDSNFGRHGSAITNLFAKLNRKRYFRTIEHHADCIITLTEEDMLLWNKAKKVVVIPNFSSLEVTNISKCRNNRIIAVGRLGEDKGFDRLIDIWKIVSKSHSDWILDIFGNGSMEGFLKNKIKTENVNNIKIHNATADISSEYAQSSIFVLTSYYEGFALVLLEAMRHGVPCIAFDCPFGPRNIIKNKECGFLIKNGDIEMFAGAINILIENYDLRMKFAQASLEQSRKFEIINIMNHWKKLFEDSITLNIN